MVPRRTLRVTSLTARKPRNSLVSPAVSRITSDVELALAITRLYHHSRSATMSSEEDLSMPRLTRRDFLLTSAAALAAAPLVPVVARAQTPIKIGTAVLGDYGLAGPVIVGIEKGLF